uniref:Uncharacterized protein n=1 Tax=Arundo donax TaxID=35708 RepID=A0A0A9HHH1_ARUDO
MLPRSSDSRHKKEVDIPAIDNTQMRHMAAPTRCRPAGRRHQLCRSVGSRHRLVSISGLSTPACRPPAG